MRCVIRLVVCVVAVAATGTGSRAFADGDAPPARGDDAARPADAGTEGGGSAWAGAAGGAASGATAGLFLGPIGVAAGSVVGGVVGFLGGGGAALHHDEEVGGGRGEPGGPAVQDEAGRRAAERSAVDEYNHRRFLEQIWTAP